MPEQRDNRPNILLLHSDQHQAAITGCYGDPVIQTPNLDRLASRGVVLDNMYCESPICVPSRMSFMTGQHPYQNRLWTNSHILDSNIPTMMHALGAVGYRPMLIGRAHFIGPDQLHGYAERYVGDHSPNYLGGRPVDRGILEGTAGPHRVSLKRSGPGQSAYQVHDQDVAAATVNYLNRLGVRKRGGYNLEPFAITIGFMLPHPPYVARRKDYDRYKGRVGMPHYPEPFSDRLHPLVRWWRLQTDIKDVTDEEIIRSRTSYWAMVDALDDMIGQILESLERNGFGDNTLVIYTTDHGDHIGEHSLWWKHTFYEESARVPAIISWPGLLPQGTRCARVAGQIDLNATILDAAGARPLPHSQGRSLLRVLQDPSTPWDDIAFSEYCSDQSAAWQQSNWSPTAEPPRFGGLEGLYHRMVRREEWKLNYYHGLEPQLFNLKEDSHEMYDRAKDPGCQSIREELMAHVLEGWDPVQVARQMDKMLKDQRLISEWARFIQPEDQYRWELRAEMNYLDTKLD